MVLVMLPDCPIARKYAPEINRIYAEFGTRASFSIALSDPDAKLEEMAKWRTEFGFKMPVLMDPGLTIARRFGATHTPTAIVTTARGEAVYVGRIDDRFVSLGRARTQPTQRDLMGVVDALLQGRRLAFRTTAVTGCTLPLD